jgi:heavy metal translocating P-type ATPase
MFILTSITIAGAFFAVGCHKKIRSRKSKSSEDKNATKALRKYLTSFREKSNLPRSLKSSLCSLDGVFTPRRSHTSKAGTADLSMVEQRLVSDEEKEINRVLLVTSGNFVIAGASLVYPPLLWLTAPGLVYTMLPYYRLIKQSIKQRRVNSYMVDACLGIGMLASGYIYTVIIGNCVAWSGRKLLLMSENRSKQSIGNLFGEQIESVWIVTEEGVENQVPFKSLRLGNTIVVSAGQIIPADGTIIEGSAAVNQQQLTGESMPAEKGVGDLVLASTVVLTGRIYFRAERTGEETTARRIGAILNQTADYKASIQSHGERIADDTTPIFIGLSAAFLPTLGLNASLAVLTNTFGYKMRLLAPATILTYLEIASREGILIKDGRVLELLNEIDTVVFDKTGTLTLEQPSVKAIHVQPGICEKDVLRYAAAAESKQSHPVACAIIKEAHRQAISWTAPAETKVVLGYGLYAKLDDQEILVGSARFMALEAIEIPAPLMEAQASCHQHGNSLVFVSLDRQIVGAIELSPTIRPEAKRVVAWLHSEGIMTYILSGDHEGPTQSLAAQLGVDGYTAEVLPSDKASFVQTLQSSKRKVCFVGDGINDSIALKQANVSVSMSGATTAATDTAQIVLMDGTLENFERLFRLARETKGNLRTGFLISTVPSVLCVGGIVFLHLGLIAAYSITLSVLFIGIGNSTAPLLRVAARSKRSPAPISAQSK